jgi:hypothetical protein
MTHRLSEVLAAAYRRAGILKVGTLTSSVASGTATEFLDSALIDDTSDDDFNEGAFFILNGQTASGASNQVRKITDYAASSGQFTVSPGVVFSSAASSVVYAYTTPEFGMDLMVQLLNDALKSAGDMVFADKNTVVSSAAQTEYQMELAWKRSEPFQVDLQTKVGSTATDNAWNTIYGWHYEPAVGGSTSGRIIFDKYLPVGRKVRVWYMGPHQDIANSTDAVDERLHFDLVVALLVERMYEYRNSLNRGSLPFDIQRWNDAKVVAQQMRVQYPIWKPKKKPKLLSLGGDSGDHLPYPYPYGP